MGKATSRGSNQLGGSQSVERVDGNKYSRNSYKFIAIAVFSSLSCQGFYIF